MILFNVIFINVFIYNIGEVAFFNARAGVTETRQTYCNRVHDAQAVRPYQVSDPLHLTVLAAKTVVYTTVPQCPQTLILE